MRTLGSGRPSVKVDGGEDAGLRATPCEAGCWERRGMLRVLSDRKTVKSERESKRSRWGSEELLS